RLDEVFEEAAALLLVFRDVVLQCRYRHGGYVAHCEGGGELDAQGEPFDVAVEFAREQERGLQGRVHAIVLFDRHQNGLETHGDLPFVRAPPAARRGERGPRRLAFRARPSAERPAPRSLPSIMPTAGQARSSAARLPHSGIAPLPLCPLRALAASGRLA